MYLIANLLSTFEEEATVGGQEVGTEVEMLHSLFQSIGITGVTRLCGE